MIPTPVAVPRLGDPAAFVAQHQRGVLRWLRLLGCEPARAEEHCQDALLAALHHGMDQRPAPVAARWLRTAARNAFWMALRRERRQPRVAELAELEQAWLAVHGDQDGGDGALEALHECLDGAEPRDRALLEQSYRDEVSREAMAESFGLGEAGIKQALRRARRRMQQCVEGKLAARAAREER